jgi:hypothetical protein
MLRHERTVHAADKYYRCIECDNSFATEEELNTHCASFSHTPEITQGADKAKSKKRQSSVSSTPLDQNAFLKAKKANTASMILKHKRSFGSSDNEYDATKHQGISNIPLNYSTSIQLPFTTEDPRTLFNVPTPQQLQAQQEIINTQQALLDSQKAQLLAQQRMLQEAGAFQQNFVNQTFNQQHVSHSGFTPTAFTAMQGNPIFINMPIYNPQAMAQTPQSTLAHNGQNGQNSQILNQNGQLKMPQFNPKLTLQQSRQFSDSSLYSGTSYGVQNSSISSTTFKEQEKNDPLRLSTWFPDLKQKSPLAFELLALQSPDLQMFEPTDGLLQQDDGIGGSEWDSKQFAFPLLGLEDPLLTDDDY